MNLLKLGGGDRACIMFDGSAKSLKLVGVGRSQHTTQTEPGQLALQGTLVGCTPGAVRGDTCMGESLYHRRTEASHSSHHLSLPHTPVSKHTQTCTPALRRIHALNTQILPNSKHTNISTSATGTQTQSQFKRWVGRFCVKAQNDLKQRFLLNCVVRCCRTITHILCDID